MKVLLTGAFGNVGTSAIIELEKKGYSIRCFDVETKRNKKRSQKFKNTKNLEIFWGDILDKDSIRKALEGIDVIIHLAAIIPPLSESNPSLGQKVNIIGSKNIIEEAEQVSNIKQFIYSSSVSIHGHQSPDNPLLRTDSPLIPTDNYTKAKTEIENFIYNCNLNWTIVRFGAVMVFGAQAETDYEMIFGIPLDQKVEIIHTYDAGKSVVNAVDNEKAMKKIFFGGGGKICQLNQREMMGPMLGAMGIGKFPDKAFLVPKTDDEWFYTHWMDTEESQEVLQYQTLNFDDFIKEYRKQNRLTRYFLTLIRPIVKRSILKKSKYYK